LSEYYQKPVTIHFIPGNHDVWRIQAVSAPKGAVVTRLEVNGSVFDNQYLQYNDGKPFVLVRHGHEYDHSNFSVDLRTWPEIPISSTSPTMINRSWVILLPLKLPRNCHFFLGSIMGMNRSLQWTICYTLQPA
jgi:hypothetical protein